ncbi:MAG TPA: EAL domain-containing protein [Candidatus Dormibacteraeota bacterium]|nr:EAL domain-containing protein [Candidatus Dormibacteraeota bacterium]
MRARLRAALRRCVAARSAQRRSAASLVAVRRMWTLTALLGCCAALCFLTVVSRLALAPPAVAIPWVVFAALFCIAEARRVHIHFRRNAHSFSLSEIPLVLGLYFASPQTLVSSRLAGAAVALWLIRRQPPVRVVFNLTLYAVEAELAMWLISVFEPLRSVTSPHSWAVMLAIVAVIAVLGFSLSATVISIAEGRLGRAQLVRGYLFSVGAGLVNACLAIQAAAAISRNLAELWLLGTPLLGVAVAFILYTSEHQKRQRIQHLYECSDLLQRTAVADAAVPELLAQISQVFSGELAEVVLLPVATGTGRASTTTLRHGLVRRHDAEVDRAFLEGLMMAVGSETRARAITWADSTGNVRDWLTRHGLKDAMLTSLWGDGALLGVLTVGNRLNDVGTFSADDLTLFETFGAHTSVAVQTMRLDNTLTYQAFHDPLTNLANRLLFTDRLEHALSRRHEKRGMIAVLFVDLDDFKMVNDTFGHAAGDDLLRSVAERLRSVLRSADTAARFGGDEFAVLLEDAPSADDITAVAERVVTALRPHFVVERQEVAVHASIGVALATASTVGAEELLRRADAAMYWAKVQGKGGYEIYDAGMIEGSGRRLQVRTELERALTDGDLRVHYQPIVDLRSAEVRGVEALVRWEHPERGWILPGEFIGIAEETGLIADLGAFVLREACAQLQTWESTLPLQDDFQLHVNVSQRQLRTDDAIDAVRAILAETAVAPRRLVVEMTESFVGEHGDVARERMRELKALGVSLAIDDFGTGYSSLALLQDMPFDILKVDRAFIDDLDGDRRRRAFTAAIFGLGDTLGLTMIAEGVEREKQRSTLLALGCTLAQGFLFSSAVPGQQIADMLRGQGSIGGVVPLRVLSAGDRPAARAKSLPA